MVEPISLIYDSNEYYLTCYDAECSENRNYRLDRIERVELLDAVICDETRSRRRGIARYKASIFRMYGGDTEKVALEFDHSVIESIYDTFGLGTRIRPCGEWFSAKVDVQISPTFWGWVFQFAGRIRITEPKEIEQEYIHQLCKALDLQKDTD